jgi:hypothetical protein
MGPVYALSVHKFVNSVGADAGFAAIIGLAILVLLYFAHARETASLREQLAASDLRVQDLEAHVAELAHLARVTPAAQSAPAPQPLNPVAAGGGPTPTVRRTAPVGAPAVAAAGAAGAVAVAPRPATAAAQVPVAPAGVGAPALTAATKLIPTTGPESAAPAPVSVAPAPEAAQAPVTSPDVTPAPATVAAGAGTATAARPPMPPVATANGRSDPATATATAPATRRQDPQPPARPTSEPASRASFAGPPRQIRPGAAAARQAIIPGRGSQPTGSRVTRAVAIAVLALVAAAIIVVLVAVTSSGGSTHSTSTPAAVPTTNAPAPRRVSHARPVDKTAVVVAVLNGTPQAGLARRISGQLTADGYKQGTVATASDSTRTATVIAYLPGHRAEALSVATSLKLGSASVQPVDQPTQAIACPPPAACRATVIVTVGADLKTQ